VTVGFNQTADLISGSEYYMRLESLLALDSRGRPVPDMVTKVPTTANGGIRDGGKTIVFTLKRGLRWSDGTEITSANIRFGWQTANDPASDPTNTCPYCSLISRIDTPDRYTAVFHLPHAASPTFLGSLTGAPDAVVPTSWGKWWNHDPHAAAVAYNVDPNFPRNGPQFPSNGPYYLASATDTESVFHPMKYYSTMSCGALIQTIKLRAYASVPALITAAAAHQVDVISAPGVTIADLRELKRHRSAFVTHLDPSFFMEHLEFNVDPTYGGEPNPVYDARVRLALALALDKIRVIKHALPLDSLEASRSVAWSPLVNTPKLRGEGADRSINGQWDPLLHKYTADTGRGQALADARKLLGETAWKHGFSLDFYTTSNNPIRQAEEEAIASDWARIGVHVVPHFVSSTTLFATLANGGIMAHGHFQVALFGHYTGTLDEFSLESKYRTRVAGVNPTDTSFSNTDGIHDRIIDKAFEVSAHTFDTKVRNQSLAAIQREIVQQAYWIQLYPRVDVWTDDRRVQNLRNHAAEETLFWNTYAWKLKGS
jgi:ABC-type transport system substrate-binding protein